MDNDVHGHFARGSNIFLHGPAGTGKTYLIKELINQIDKTGQKNAIVAAPTGLAATHINGSTIHSHFGIPAFNMPEKLKELILEYDYTDVASARDEDMKTLHKFVCNIVRRSSFSESDLAYLFIDEISMTGAVLFTIVDAILRERYKRNLFMGGVQCVFSGDFYQLPPVKDKYCCFTKAWKNGNIETIDMVESRRYDDPTEYFEFICRLRKATLMPQDLDLIKSRLDAHKSGLYRDLPIKPIILYPTNKEIDACNNRELAKIDGNEYVFNSLDTIKFMAGIKGAELRTCNINAENALNDIMPAELHLKVGAQIIFITNYNIGLKLVNGRMGKIVAITKVVNDETPLVEDIPQTIVEPDDIFDYLITISDIEGHEHVIRPHSLSNTHRKFSCTRIQFPFKLAWAISIHRSQGMSVDAAVIDIGGCFCAGQSYVAISRVRNVDGLFITNANLRKIRRDEDIYRCFQ